MQGAAVDSRGINEERTELRGVYSHGVGEVYHDKIVLYAAAVCLGSVESSVACDAARRGGIDY